jgi:hypothetical protein
MFRLSRSCCLVTYVVVVPSDTGRTLPHRRARIGGPGPGHSGPNLFFGWIKEAAPPGQPRILEAGDIGWMLTTEPAVIVPPPPRSDGRMQVYRTTYFPRADDARLWQRRFELGER